MITKDGILSLILVPFMARSSSPICMFPLKAAAFCHQIKQAKSISYWIIAGFIRLSDPRLSQTTCSFVHRCNIPYMQYLSSYPIQHLYDDVRFRWIQRILSKCYSDEAIVSARDLDLRFVLNGTWKITKKFIAKGTSKVPYWIISSSYGMTLRM